MVFIRFIVKYRRIILFKWEKFVLFSLTEGVTNWYPLFYLHFNYEKFTFFVLYFVPSNFGIASKILISLQTQISYVHTHSFRPIYHQAIIYLKDNVINCINYECRTNITVKEMKEISMALILVILEKDNQRTLYGFFFKGDLV